MLTPYFQRQKMVIRKSRPKTKRIKCRTHALHNKQVRRIAKMTWEWKTYVDLLDVLMCPKIIPVRIKIHLPTKKHNCLPPKSPVENNSSKKKEEKPNGGIKCENARRAGNNEISTGESTAKEDWNAPLCSSRSFHAWSTNNNEWLMTKIKSNFWRKKLRTS